MQRQEQGSTRRSSRSGSNHSLAESGKEGRDLLPRETGDRIEAIPRVSVAAGLIAPVEKDSLQSYRQEEKDSLQSYRQETSCLTA